MLDNNNIWLFFNKYIFLFHINSEFYIQIVPCSINRSRNKLSWISIFLAVY